MIGCGSTIFIIGVHAVSRPASVIANDGVSARVYELRANAEITSLSGSDTNHQTVPGGPLLQDVDLSPKAVIIRRSVPVPDSI